MRRYDVKLFAKAIAAACVAGCFTACSTTSSVPIIETSGSTSTVVLRETVNELEKDQVPGTVNEVWVEPMYDTIEMPGQIYGNTYRIPHKAVVEIRPGKMQKVEYPDGNEQYAVPR